MHKADMLWVTGMPFVVDPKMPAAVMVNFRDVER
jgi:hypothetical protein